MHELRTEKINTYGTPRRLTVIVDDVADKQTSISVEMMGPPERIAMDEKGNLTVPGQKFAEKISVSPKQLKVKENGKRAISLCSENRTRHCDENVFKGNSS